MLVLLFGHNSNLFSQSNEIDVVRKFAEHSFSTQDYDFALENYLQLYELDKSDININYRIGVCYTETNINKTGGIPYLEFVVSHNNFPKEAYYYLGKAYMFNYQFIEAVEALYEYKLAGTQMNLVGLSEQLIAMSYNAMEFINQPRPVRFELLDTAVNSTLNDFRPLVTADEQKLFFTSNRRYINSIAQNVNDIYMAETKGTAWGQAGILDISSINNEEIVGIAPNGEQLMITVNGEFITNEIRIAERKGRRYNLLPAKEVPQDLNVVASLEQGACIDSKGTMIIFASDRLGGFGGMDLYKIVKKDRNTWGEAENLGSQINTRFDECYPSLSVDGQKLHFSSNSENSIGGFDLFYSVFNMADSSFQRPINHGFPLSTPFDDISISFNVDETVAYLATTRNEGIGNLDIYKVHITKESPKTMIIVGTVMIGTEQNSIPYTSDDIKVWATIYDPAGNLFSKYSLNEEGMFFITLYPGDYILDVRFDKAPDGYRQTLNLKESDEDMQERTIYLQIPR